MSKAFECRPFIDGRRTESRSIETFNVVDPHLGISIAAVPACNTEDVDQAVRAARYAFQDGGWSEISPSERAMHLRVWADVLQGSAKELATLDSMQMGMPLSWGAEDILGAIDGVRETAALATTLRDDLVPAAPGNLMMNIRKPHGVVGVISPWNFPSYIAINKVAAAIMMGNTVVLKPSEVAPLACLRLAELASEAGIPKGVFNAVPGLGNQAGKALALHMDVDALTFTGSTATAGALMSYAGQSNLKALMLECGGKSPQVVFDDLGDLDALARALVDGFTFNTGQVCVAGTRIIVHRSLMKSLQDRMLALMAELRAGDPRNPEVTLGPLATEVQNTRVQTMLAAATSRGVQLHQPASTLGGLHFSPTLATGLGSDDPLMQEEIFGPVAGLIPFDSSDQAVGLANNSRYGLMATAWTSDTRLAYRLTRSLRAGVLQVNTVPTPAPSHAMHMGSEPIGQSGFGVEGGVAGLLSMTRLRSVGIHLG